MKSSSRNGNDTIGTSPTGVTTPGRIFTNSGGLSKTGAATSSGSQSVAASAGSVVLHVSMMSGTAGANLVLNPATVTVAGPTGRSVRMANPPPVPESTEGLTATQHDSP